MTTTAVFAEIIVIGLEAVVWVALLVVSLFDLSPILSALTGWETLATIGVLAAAYVLGVIVDRIADTLFTPLLKRTSSDLSSDQFQGARRALLARGGPLTAFIEYQRSRMRLMRGSILNLVLALPFANILIVRANENLPTLLISINLLVILLVAATTYTYLRIGAAEHDWLARIARAPADEGPNPDA